MELNRTRQSACRWQHALHIHEPGGGLPPPPTRLTMTHTCTMMNPVVGCHYSLSGPQLLSQPSGITALRPTYTAWWQRHIGVINLPRFFYAVSRPTFKHTTTWPQVGGSTTVPRRHLITSWCPDKQLPVNCPPPDRCP